MTTHLVLTIIGDDKPGLVEKLSRVIADNSGNWLHSSMSQLAGKFAGILQVSVPDKAADKLIADLNTLSDSLRLVIERVEMYANDPLMRTITLNLVGNDRPGIIRDVSRALARSAVNVEDLETGCMPAPMSSDILFRARAVLRVPENVDLDGLRNELERIADDLIVEIQLE
ncbi:MAG: ACT domain-containing protein [Pseudohongiellaceae bacterium]